MNAISNKHTPLLVAAGLLSLLLGVFCGPALLRRLAPPVEYVGHANASEPAVSVAEETASADLIVRARVVSLQNRILKEVLPVYAEDAVTIIDQRETSTPFTDVTLEVLETFKGESEPFILVLQTGGTLTHGPFGRDQKFTIAADPLFEKGSEHILFLVDITDDGVHSTGRQLYRVVNPMGRYELREKDVLIGPDQFEPVAPNVLAQLPQTGQELREQIHLALATQGDYPSGMQGSMGTGAESGSSSACGFAVPASSDSHVPLGVYLAGFAALVAARRRR